MIVVDTSALLAILQGEEKAEACRDCLAAADHVLMPAPTFTEALILAAARALMPALETLLDGLPIEVVPLTEEGAARAARAYVRWGKGFHPARLNFGESFPYSLARELGCPLLFVGNDFDQTDIESALG